MALINCPECGKQISNKAGSCPNCGCPINKVEIETEQDRINVRGKNKGKNCLVFGAVFFVISMIFGMSTVDAELMLRAKKLTKGLYGAEAFKWFVLRYAPSLLLWISVILVVIGIIFLITSKRKNK